MDDKELERRAARARIRRRRQISRLINLILAGILLLLIIIALIIFAVKHLPSGEKAPKEPKTPGVEETMEGESGGETLPEETEPQGPQTVDEYIAEADRLAAGYDYDAAIAFLGDSPFAEEEAVKNAVAGYEETKGTLVRQNVREITHVFFHTLIMDNSKAFDGDTREAGYNQVMTTKSEFEKILQNMYDRGFVLVRIHDMGHEETGEDGVTRMVEGDIMLPPGKQAFVMSQDDVCYYEYMTGDGFATKLIIGEDGRPTNEMLMDDGTVEVGSFDLIPMLDDFIDEHPDFSYKGAKAIIAITGYNGIFGYRTDDSYATAEYAAANPGFDYAAEVEGAKAISQCILDDGFEIASHSWGHRNYGKISMEDFKADADKWNNRVAPLIGGTDIIIYPFGSDISDWHPYDTSGARYQYLHNLGFRYFCPVDSNQYFVQIGDDYLRQGRRNLDGYRMYYDLPETNPKKQHLTDLFNVEEVFDRSRPVPVPPMS